MFDIGPFELLIIFVVALLVIGPEKLPGTIKTASLWLGRFRRSFHKIKAEVEKELNADEIRRQLHNESIMEEVENAKAKVNEVTKEVKSIADDANPKDDMDLGLDTASKDESARAASAEESAAVNPATDSKPAEEKDSSITGELKQAVSYVNDISRDVKESAKEIEAEFEEPASDKLSSEKPASEKKAESGES